MNSRIITYILGLGFIVFITAGCSETPETQAAKQARIQAEKAAKIVADYNLGVGYDYAKAKEEVDKAIGLANSAGGNADGVFFTSASLTAAYAQKEGGVLSDLQQRASQRLALCLNTARRLSETASQSKTIEMLMGSGELEAASLKELLRGEQTGIKERLSENQKQLAALKEQLESYVRAAETARKAAADINLKADTMLREAQLLKGQQRIDLERKAYSLLKGNGDNISIFHYQKLQQENLDKASAVEVQINTVEPLIPKLQKDVDFVSQRIAALDNQDQTLNFSGQIAALNTLEQQLISELQTHKEQFDIAFEAYMQQLSKIKELYADAEQNFGKVKSQGLREMAQLKIADSKRAVARLNVGVNRFIAASADRAAAVAGVYLEDIDTGIEPLKNSLAALSDEYTRKAVDAFEAAFERYQTIIDRYSSGEFADTVVRSYMTAIHDRLGFDSGADMAQLKSELLEKVERIKDISIQNDPQFGNSKVASLFAGYGIEFKTAEQRLQEEYQQLKVRFAAAQSISEAQKQAQLLSLLDDFGLLSRPEDERFYNEFVKYVYELFRDDWLDIYESQPDVDKLQVFSEFIAQDTAVDEPVDTGSDFAVSDPNF